MKLDLILSRVPPRRDVARLQDASQLSTPDLSQRVFRQCTHDHDSARHLMVREVTGRELPELCFRRSAALPKDHGCSHILAERRMRDWKCGGFEHGRMA